MNSAESDIEPNNVLYRIQRGLAGYVSYLAACEMNEAFSEYVLYEPMLRILTARGFTVKCESPCPGFERPTGRGDCKKIDFEAASQAGCQIAIEVKWKREIRLDLENDREKLAAFHTHNPQSRSFLCVFGRKSDIEDINIAELGFTEQGEAVYANFGKTIYGCRIYELVLTAGSTMPPVAAAESDSCPV